MKRSTASGRMLRHCAMLGLGALFAACVPPHQTAATPQHGRVCAHVQQGGQASALDWYLPAVADEHERLDAWCKAVGPAVIDSVPSDAFASLLPNDSLAIAVWNTDAGAGDTQTFLDRELGLDCSGASPLLETGATHFVLLIQEALRRSNEIPNVSQQSATPPPVKENTRPGERLGVVELAERCGLALFYVPGARNGHGQRDGKREDKGEAILSTLPLSDFIAIELPYEAARRVVVAATLRDAGGDSLRLASVHFISSPPPWRVLQTANSSRLRQALALVDALEQIEFARRSNSAPEAGTSSSRAPGHVTIHRGISTVVAGDLNTWSTQETTLRHMWTHFPESPRPLAVPTRGPFPTDHLLFRRKHHLSGVPDRIIERSYRRIDDTYYSDHHPIIAWYDFGS